jgi:CheY-like chemotaxis protein
MNDPGHVSIPVNILIVDDRLENRVAMEALLRDESLGYQIVTATSGSEAIERVKETEFALILMDIQMPGMDGYETVKQIKELDNGKDVPIVMVSAIFKEDPYVLKGYSVGAMDYICKPFNPEVFKAKVNVYANLYMKTRQLMLLGAE